MNPSQGEKEVLSKEEIVKGFRRLGEGGFGRCISDYVKSSFFAPKFSANLMHGLSLSEVFMDEMMKFGIVGTPKPPAAARMTNLRTFLEVTIIDDHHFVYPNLFLIEDKKKSLGVLFVDDMDSTKAKEFQFGAVIRIENPEAVPLPGPLGRFYMTSCRIPSCCFATVVGKKENMCRYCLKENAEMKCKECKRLYCGRECQVKDWKLQDHKTICKLTAGRFT